MRRRSRPPTKGKVGWTFKFLPKQAEFWRLLDEGRRFVAYVGGIRGGKTYVGARRALYEAVKRGGLGWIVAPTYPMSEIPKREFEGVLGQYPHVVAQHRDHPSPYWRLATPNNPEIEIRSGEFPDRLRGPGLSWVWIDEGAMLDVEAWRVLLGRVMDTKGVIFITTTPKGRNWVWEEFARGASPEFAFVTSRTEENTYLPQEDLQMFRERFGVGSSWARQELDAEFVMFEGLVYPDFDPALHVSPPPRREQMLEVIGGMDWGYHDPMALLAVGRDVNRCWWVMDELVDQRLSPSEVARDTAAFCRQWGVRRVWADSSRPDMLDELRRSGVPILPAKSCKPVTLGVSLVSGLLRAGRLRIAPHCRWTITEFGTYSFKRQPGTDKAKTGEVPEDRHNHALDALRYALWSIEPPQQAGVWNDAAAQFRMSQPSWRS